MWDVVDKVDIHEQIRPGVTAIDLLDGTYQMFSLLKKSVKYRLVSHSLAPGRAKMVSHLVGKIDLLRFDLDGEIEFINGLPKIVASYDEFAQGYWKNISLKNASGDDEDIQYRNTGCARETPDTSPAKSAVDKRVLKDLIFLSSKYHYKFDVPVAECYDWIIDTARSNHDEALHEMAGVIKKYMVANH